VSQWQPSLCRLSWHGTHARRLCQLSSRDVRMRPAHAAPSRNSMWTSIWSARAHNCSGKSLSEVDGFEYPKGAYAKLVRLHLKKSGLLGGNALSVIEAGCGAGAFLDQVIQQAGISAHRVHGFDVSTGMVELARRRLPDAELRAASLQGPLPYAPRSFDYTFAMGALQYLDTVDDAAFAYRELLRITAPGGIVMVGCLPDPTRRAQEAAVRGGAQANRDKASPLPSPGHIYTPSSTFATLCVMAGGESKTIKLWKAGHHLEMAGVKQVSYWFSHMCTLPTPGGTSASSSGAHNRRPIKHRDWRRNIRGNTSEYRSLR